MSIVSKFIGSIGSSSIRPPSDGKSYSLSELCLMEDGDLGKLYRAWVNREIPGSLRRTIFKYSLAAGGLISVGSIIMSTIFDPGPSFIADFIAGILGFCFLAPFNIIICFIIISMFVEINIEDKIESLLSKVLLSQVTKSFNLNILQSLNIFQESLKTCGGEQSSLNEFIEDLSHVLKSNRIINKYSNEELGRLLKIILPIMKFEHDGGILNDETFATLDSDLDLTGRMRAFHDDITIRVYNELENEDLEMEQKKKDKQKSLASNIARDLNDAMSENDNHKDVLKNSVEMERIIDANARLEEKKEELNMSLAGQQSN